MAVKQYTRNGKIFYRVSVNIRSKINQKIRFQKSKEGIETQAKANRVEKELYKLGIQEVQRRDGQGYTWEQIVKKWHNYKVMDTYDPIGETTLKDYYAALQKWTSQLSDKAAKEISRSDIKRIIEAIRIDGCSVSHQSKVKGLIKAVYTWGIEEGLIIGVHQSPTIGIKTDRKKEKLQPILNRNEIHTLLEKAQFLDNPWQPIWAMAIHTGCRSGELYALKWTDIDFLNEKIHIKKSYDKRHRRINEWTKGKKWRTVPINSELRKLLVKLQGEFNSEFVLPRIRAWTNGYQATEIRDFCKGIGITPINFHALRACFATQLLQNDVAPIIVMKMGGWNSLKSMAHYIRLSGIEEAGATNSLRFPTTAEFNEQLIELFASKG